MPWVSGNYFSKRSIEADEAFLKTQGLSPEQVASISAYLLQRYSSLVWFNAAFAFGAGIFLGVILRR